ncbi:MAG: hypothetical protein PQJ44_07615 [Sphaerochaetaceae bacterium]|nr:hypothetical protein [Sphaerochaetaceae bacterium]
MYKFVLKLILFSIFLCKIIAQVPNGRAFGWIDFPSTEEKLVYPMNIFFSDNNYSLKVEIEESDIPFSVEESSMLINSGYSYYIEEGTYNIEDNGGIKFFHTDKESILDNTLILYSKLSIIFIKNNNLIFMSQYLGNANEARPFITSVSESSFLKEGNVEYKGQNVDLVQKAINEAYIPWVENAEEYGIGESITVRFSGFIPLRGFLLSNGYVSYERPDLYLKNSRIKKIRIENSVGVSKEFDLEDSSNLQYLDFYNEYREDFEFEEIYTFTILDVYPGTEWSDTCLNMIIPTSKINMGLK